MPRTQPPVFPAAPAAPPAIILTAGDVSVDWLWFDLNPTDHDALRAGWEAGHPNTYRKWVHRAQVVNAAVHGGAWYLDTLVRMLAGFEHEEYVFGYARYSSAHLRMLTTNQFVHTDTGYELQDYTPGSRDKDAKPPKGVYRVKNGPTFSGPMDHAHAPVPRLTGEPAGPFVVKAAADRKARDQAPPAPPPPPPAAPPAPPPPPPAAPPATLPAGPFPGGLPTVLLLHDECNGFAHTDDAWKNLFNAVAPEVGPAIKAVILNVSNREGLLGVLAKPPEKLPPNALWKHVAAGHANDLVVLASADDLRAAGVRISRSLSWERTALDVADGLATHPVLRELGKARHLIVRFGVSGALHATRDGSGQHQLVLYYDPMHLEGEFRDVARQGEMIGYNSVFAATLATAVRARLAAGTPPALPAGQTLLDNALADEGGGGAVRAGVANCRAYFLNGFGPVARDNHRRLEEWDQLGNPDARRTYPSQLTAQAIYRQEHVGGPEHLATFELTQAERLPFLDPFFPRWFANAPSSKRRHGGELIDPVELLKELEARMELVFEAHRAEVKAAGGPKVKLWKTTWDLPTTSDWMIICAVTAPRAGRKALADAMATSCARVKPGTRPRAAARDYIDGVKDLVGIDLDWDYGWPVRVRAFAADAARVARAVLPVGRDPEWEILPFDRAVLRDIAREIVCRGAKAAFARPSTAAGGGDGRFPVAEFGDLRTADRAEGESYRSVRNLIRDYLGKRDPDRPLSLAVFGPPGGGKSFGVKQIAKSLGKDRVVEDENNLSQFTSPADLSRALIRTRDKGVGSKVPLVFFDEFDAALGGEQLAWLKYFLSVMQDGTHRFEGGDLRVGPAILVFAGGTSTTFAGFAREAGGDAADRERFVRAKGPDFVSRLRGHVNIVGPNPSQVAGSVDADPGCLIRRALILDHQLRRHHKKLVDSKKKLRIDDRALQLLLAVPCYTHGSRSVEAVVETSTPVGSDRFDTSALLAAEQLAMHVNWGAGTWDEFVARQDRKPWWP